MNALNAAPLADSNRLAATAGAKVWWLGQAGFLLAQGGLRIVVDPYLSDSLAEKYRGQPFPHVRMMPPPVAAAALERIDWVLCTHGHTDHMDPGTLPQLAAANPAARFLVPRAERARAVERGAPADRLATIDAGETIDLGGVLCTAIPAAHEAMSRSADGHLYLGFVLSGGGVAVYHSGDTIPWPGQAEWLLPFRVDLALLPVNGRDAVRAANGVPGNLTLTEAVHLGDAIGARAVLGHHFGLFDFNTLDLVAGTEQLAGLAHRAQVELVQAGVAYAVEPHPRPARGVLFVCRGNICRSPTAAAVLRRLLPTERVDSAAIEDWNVGRPAHADTCAVAAMHGLDLSSHMARQITTADFARDDLILALDAMTEAALLRLQPPDPPARVVLLGALMQPGERRDIADPWGKPRADFELAFDHIDAACRRLAGLIRSSTKEGKSSWISD